MSGEADIVQRNMNNIAADRVGLIRPYRRLNDSFLRGIAWYGGVNFLAGPDHRARSSSSPAETTAWTTFSRKER